MPSNWQQLDKIAAENERAVLAGERLLAALRERAVKSREQADAEFQRWQNDKTA